MTTPTPSIRTKVLAGAAWMVAIKWTFRLLGLLSTMVLARLLTPADFGIVAIAMALVAILDSFFDFGFDIALIKNKNPTRDDYDLVWSLRFTNMLIFAALVALTSPLIAHYANAPESIAICLVLALSIALRGLHNIGTIDFQKELEFSRLFQFQLYPRLLSVATTIVLAFWLRTYWAIILGALANSAYSVIFSYIMSPYRPRLRFRGARSIWVFSKWVLLANMTRQMFNALDKLLLSGLVSKVQLGYFNIAASLSSIVTIELVSPVGAALMPGFAKLQSEPERLRDAFFQSVTVLFALMLPAGFGVWLVAPELVFVILGWQWEGAIHFVALFGIFFLFFSLSETLSNFMAMVGLIHQSALVSLIRTLLFVASFYFAFQLDGIEGVIFLKIALSVLEVGVLFFLSCRFLQCSVGAGWQLIWRPVLSVGAMALAVASLPPIPGAAPVVLLAIKVSVGGLAYAATSLVLWSIARRPRGLESLVLDMLNQRLGTRIKTAAS